MASAWSTTYLQNRDWTIKELRSRQYALPASSQPRRCKNLAARSRPDPDSPAGLTTRFKMENSMPEIRDILRNRVKEKFARDEVVSSMTVRLVRHIEIARIAASAGFDTLYVDVEHNGFSWDTTGQICQAALAAGITPF